MLQRVSRPIRLHRRIWELGVGQSLVWTCCRPLFSDVYDETISSHVGKNFFPELSQLTLGTGSKASKVDERGTSIGLGSEKRHQACGESCRTWTRRERTQGQTSPPRPDLGHFQGSLTPAKFVSLINNSTLVEATQYCNLHRSMSDLLAGPSPMNRRSTPAKLPGLLFVQSSVAAQMHNLSISPNLATRQ
jgi:hypothetical protein